MNPYYAVIGKAVLKPAFRDALMAEGSAAASDAEFPGLTPDDRAHLNDFMNAPAPRKADASIGFGSAQAGVNAVCQTPPCPYSP
jgi:hypothetical protein